MTTFAWLCILGAAYVAGLASERFAAWVARRNDAAIKRMVGEALPHHATTRGER